MIIVVVLAPVLPTDPAPVPPARPASWIDDPTGRHQQRYWDGQQWTDHVADAGQTSTDPIVPAPPH